MVSPRYLIFGLGQTGRAAARMLLAQQARVVAVYNRSRHVGEDLGEVLGSAATGLQVQPVAAFVPRPGLADVALFFTTSDLDDLMNEARRCLDAGIRVLTIAEPAAELWLQNPKVARALDDAARNGRAALLATGMNDGPMTQLPLTLAAMSQGVTHITSHTVACLDHLGAATLGGMGIGAPPGPAPDDAPPFAITASVARAMATRLGTQLQQLDVQVEPLLAGTDLHLPLLGLDVPRGHVSGVCETATGLTEAGLTLDVRLTGKVFELGDREQVTAQVTGTPSLAMTLHPTGSTGGFTEATAALVLNRVATVMQALPGLLTFDQLGAEQYRT